MAYDKQKVIDIALAEVGYLEKKSNAQLDDPTANAGNKNYTKYARDLAVYPFYNGSKTAVAWCDVFVDWCFVQAYGLENALSLTCQPTNASRNYGAGCKWSRSYYKSKGKLHTSDPQPGDQIFFYSKDKSSISHTGLVYKVDDKKVYTVEGNTSGASGVISNGGGVCKKSYSLTYARLAGYGRPDYGDATVKPDVIPEAAPAPSAPATSGGGKTVMIELTTLRVGSQGAEVKTLQRLLTAMGYPCGAADGIFGSNTLAAVKSFQRAKKLTVDGVVGKDTWTALLK